MRCAPASKPYPTQVDRRCASVRRLRARRRRAAPDTSPEGKPSKRRRFREQIEGPQRVRRPTMLNPLTSAQLAGEARTRGFEGESDILGRATLMMRKSLQDQNSYILPGCEPPRVGRSVTDK